MAPKAQALAGKYGAKAYSSYEEMVQSDDINIVTIATPSGLHMEPTVAAAQAGKHVICEKPVEITLERIDAMIAAHEKAGTRLGGMFPYRFNDHDGPDAGGDPVRPARHDHLCASVYVPWWRTDAYYKDSWHGTQKLDGGGALMNQSIHMVDMLCDLMPPIESVQAYTATLGHTIETEDTAVAALRYKTGALGIIYGTTASFPASSAASRSRAPRAPSSTSRTVSRSGSSPTRGRKTAQIREKFIKIQGGGGVADPAAITHENHTRNFKAFLEALETGKDFWIGGPEARKAVEVILAIYRSAREKRLVKLG